MKLTRFLIPLILLAAAIATAMYFSKTAPQAQRRPQPVIVPTAEVRELAPRDYQVQVLSQGTVEPRTQTTVVSEVSGKIIEVSPRFREGNFFSKGDILLRIDPRDYESAVTIAAAELAQAQVTLDQEAAQAALAERDWARLGDGTEANSLVLRKPQLASAKASVAAARARLQQAKTNLDRTAIRAPYDGRPLQQLADVGQYITPGTQLGSIYATDYVEIRLPVPARELALLTLPERFEDDQADNASAPTVTLSGDNAQWQGKLVRIAGALDSKTRQQFVIAQVDDPYKRQPNAPIPLKIGQYVSAAIAGKTLRDVYVLPSSAVSNGNQILLVDANRKLKRANIEVLWTTTHDTVAKADIAPGMRLSLTPIALAVDGMEVRIKGEAPPPDDTAAAGKQP